MLTMELFWATDALSPLSFVFFFKFSKFIAFLSPKNDLGRTSLFSTYNTSTWFLILSSTIDSFSTEFCLLMNLKNTMAATSISSNPSPDETPIIIILVKPVKNPSLVVVYGKI